jgi:bla regulator protein blaR1
MQPLFISDFFSENIVKAICWTIIHSMWQGMILAVLTGFVMLCTKKYSPDTRYNLFVLLFAAFIFTAGFTFTYELRIVNQANTVPVLIPAPGPLPPGETIPEILHVGQPESKSFFADWFRNYCNEHASLLVALWFVVCCFRFVRTIAGIGYLQRIRHYKVHDPGEYWKNKIHELAGRLNLRTYVGLLESELVKVPLVTGFFKPLILVPIGLLTQLDEKQLEAIFLHELAHIKRKDTLVNLLQQFAKSVFFFNPAVLWLSAVISDERENCCDDIAVGATDNRRQFINALISFQEFNANGAGAYSMAFAGRKNALFFRVKRIIHNENKPLNIMEKIFLSCSFILLVATFAVAGSKQTKNQTTMNTELKDTVPPYKYKVFYEKDIMEGSSMRLEMEDEKNRVIYQFKKEGVVYQVNTYNNQVVGFLINGKDVMREKYSAYKTYIEAYLANFAVNNKKSDNPEPDPGTLPTKSFVNPLPDKSALEKSGIVVEQTTIRYVDKDYEIITGSGDNQVRQLYKEGKAVPSGKIGDYAAVTAKIISEKQRIYMQYIENEAKKKGVPVDYEKTWTPPNPTPVPVPVPMPQKENN